MLCLSVNIAAFDIAVTYLLLLAQSVKLYRLTIVKSRNVEQEISL